MHSESGTLAHMSILHQTLIKQATSNRRKEIKRKKSQTFFRTSSMLNQKDFFWNSIHWKRNIGDQFTETLRHGLYTIHERLASNARSKEKITTQLTLDNCWVWWIWSDDWLNDAAMEWIVRIFRLRNVLILRVVHQTARTNFDRFIIPVHCWNSINIPKHPTCTTFTKLIAIGFCGRPYGHVRRMIHPCTSRRM